MAELRKKYNLDAMDDNDYSKVDFNVSFGKVTEEDLERMKKEEEEEMRKMKEQEAATKK